MKKQLSQLSLRYLHSLFGVFLITILLAGCGSGGSSGSGASPVVKTPTLSVGAGTGGEAMDIRFTVILSDVSRSNVTFKYRIETANDTADAADFASTVQLDTDIAAMIVAGERTLDIVVEIDDDTGEEDDETFSLILSDVSGAVFEPAGDTLTATGTIADNDLPTLSIAAGSGDEGTDANGSVAFVVSLSSDITSSAPVSFDYATSIIATGDDRAEEGDFVSIASQSLAISTGRTATITINTTADNLYEGDETFNLVISNMSGATLASGASDTAIGTIGNDDDKPELSVENASKTEGTGDLIFVAELNKLAAEDISFSYATSIDAGAGDTAEEGDFQAITLTSGTISKGQTNTNIAVTINDDAGSDPENFTLTLSELATGAVFAGAGNTLTARGTIIDDEATGGSNTISIAAGSGNEGTATNGSVDFVVTLGSVASMTEIVSFDYATSIIGTGDDRAEESDFVSIASSRAISTGTTDTITINTTADNLYEGDETFNLVISNIIGATLASGASDTVIGTIGNDDDKPELSVGNVSKDEGTGDLIFVAELNKLAAEDISFSYATSIDASGEDTAEAGDFVAITLTSGTISKGQTNTNIAVTINDDVDSDDETFTLTLSGLATGAVFVGAGSTLKATGTILDDEIPISASLSLKSASGGEETGKVTFVFELNNMVSSTVEFKYRTEISSADTANQADFTEILETNRVIAMNATTTTIEVIVDNDEADEGPETFSLILSELSQGVVFDPAGDSLTIQGTIVDNEIPISASLSLKSASGGEANGKVVFVFELSDPVSSDVEFKYRTEISSTDTAQQADFTEILETTRVIAMNETTTTIEVIVDNDEAEEGPETFSLILSELSQGVIFEPAGVTLTATGTIADNVADGNSNGLIDITTAEQLNNIRHNLEGTSYKTSETDMGIASGCPAQGCNGYELLNDIDLSSFGNLLPIVGPDAVNSITDQCYCERERGVWNNGKCILPVPFSAIFDGKGYTISNLSISSSDRTGLFGVVSGMVKNLKLRGGSVAHTGSDLRFDSDGAVAGELLSGGIIDTVSSDLTVSGRSNAGGLVGRSYGTIRNSYATGTVSSSASSAGGLVGDFTGTIIQNSYATGVVSGAYNAGGLVGNISSGTIQNSYANVTVSGASSAGGLVGYSISSIIQNNYAMGNVNGVDGRSDKVGGLVGWIYSGGTIQNNYAMGNVNGGDGDSDEIGRVVGKKSGGTVFGNYALSSSTLENGTERSFGSDEVVEKDADDLKALVVGTTETDFSGDNNGWSEKDWNFTTGKYPSLKSYKVDETNAQIDGDLLCEQGVDWEQGDEWVQCSS